MSELRLLRLANHVWDGLVAEPPGRASVRYVVGVTSFTRTWRIALVLVDEYVVGATVVRKFGRPGRGQDGLEFKLAEEFATRTSWYDVKAAIPNVLQVHLERIDGKGLPPRTAAEVEAALVRLAPDTAEALARLRDGLPPTTVIGHREALIREQRDAVALGLEIGGLDSRELLDDDGLIADAPFLEGWTRGRVREATAIRHDSTVLDGWMRQQSRHFDVANFQDPNDPARRMTVLYADREALENQTGTDLLYFRHHRPGFVFVQYKRMRKSLRSSGDATYFPDDQLQMEIDRYRGLPIATEPDGAAEWRLTEDSFFVKLVKDDVSKPAEHKLVRGMYLPLSLMELLQKDAEAGRRAKGWSSTSLTTYLSNEEFIQLTKQGYIGTRGATTEHVTKLILASFEAARGVIVASDETDPTKALRLSHG